MGRRKGSKNLNGDKPWEKYGLTKGAYYNRLCKGIPLEGDVKRGRKKTEDTLRIEAYIAEYGNSKRKYQYGRFSGLDYENSEERLNEIREKYKNGVTDEIVFEFVNKFFPKEC